MGKTMTYFLTPQSPWAYLGHARLVALAQAKGALVDIKPFDLGRVFSVSGGLPLAKRAPQRQAHRLIEMARWAQFLNLPMNVQPKFFPVSPDAASRLIIAARTSLGEAVSLDLAGATQGVQDQLERNTDEAIAANVFGAPWYVVDGEGFWGQDRLDFVERAL